MLRVAVVAMSVLAVGSTAAEPSLDACDARVRAAPDDFDVYRCYQTYVSATGDRDGPVARLEALIDERDDDLHARTHLGRVLGFAEGDRPLDLLREAAEAYADRGNPRLEGWARAFLTWRLMVTRRFDEAEEESHRAKEAARAAGTFPLEAQIVLDQARIAFLQSDESRTWSLMRSLELDAKFETLSIDFRCAVLDMLGTIASQIELHRTALGYRLRVAELGETAGIPEWVGQGLSMAAASAWHLADLGEMDRGQALDYARRAAAAVEGRGSRMGRTSLWQARRYIADLTDGEEGLRLLEELRRESTGSALAIYHIETALGLKLRELYGSELAVPHLERALASALDSGTPRNVASALTNLSGVRLEVGPRDRAVEQALAGLDAVERLHDLQTGETTGARIFARYATAYYDLIDTLIAAEGYEPSADDLELAFEVGERMRARTLLDQLARSGLGPSVDPERKAALQGISDLQLRLLASDLTGEERGRLEERLLRLEVEEEALRAELAKAGARITDRRLPGLDELQRELRADEALLSFLLDPDDRGSWVFVMTATELRTLPLPPHSGLEAAARFWTGMLQAGGREIPGSHRLYRELMAASVEALPPGIRRLVLVPDGVLHQIPFDALQESADGPLLIDRFEMSVAPSAAVWWMLRQSDEHGDEPRALLLADPEFAGAAAWPATLRSAWRDGAEIGRLPHARKEARRAMRSLAGRGELRLDAEASEGYLKRAAPGFSIIHLAAHAIVDAEEPGRSAILLAPGPSGDDGLLQPREVGDLDLSGATIVLSACRSAGGAEIAGEGVMGLARSFFQARAGAVIGSLWPVRDRDTTELMERFYHHLSQGRSPATSLARAKRDLAGRGRPPSAWSGFVLLGSGHSAAWPEPERRLSRPLLVAAGVALLAGLIFVLRRFLL